MLRNKANRAYRTYRAHASGRSKGHSGGFTLIEVLIAVVILATGVVVVLQGLQSSLSALDGAVDKTRAAMLLRSKLGEAQAAALDGDSPSALPERGTFQDPHDAYRWRLSVDTRTPSSAGADGSSGGGAAGGLYEVNVMVWREGHERTYSSAALVYVRSPREAEKEGGLL